MLFPALDSSADVHNCNGVLTNKTCDELATPKPVPTRSIEDREESVLRGKKKMLLHELRTKLLNERRKSGIDLDISEAEEVCHNSSTSLPDCRKVVRALDQTLDSRITSARLVKSAEESKKAPTAIVANPGAQNQVVIIQQVAATPTPLLIYDLGPLIPVERRPGHRPNVTHHTENHHHRGPQVPKEPGVTTGTLDISSVPARPAKNSKGK